MNVRARLLGIGVSCLVAMACEPPADTQEDGGGGSVDGGGGGSTDGGGSGDGGDSTPAGIEVTGFNAVVVPNGGRYEQVSLDGIPPYSNGVADLTIRNLSGAPLTVHSITLTPVGATEAYEWALNEPGRTARTPFTVSEETIAADEGLAFGLFFYPLASGARDVSVDIAYGDDRHYTFTVAGRGRDNLAFSPTVASAFERLFGRSNEAASNSFEPGGLVADASGNIFFDGNVRQWADGFNTNIVMVRVDADGELAWVRELQESFIQESRDIGNNGEIGGGPDSIDADADGNVYISAERGLASSSSGGCLVMQVDAESGDIGWARHLNLNTSSESPASAAQMLRCQAVDASLADRVIVAGQVADSAGGFLFALSKTDGALLFARTFGAGATRVGALVGDAANGRVYLGGTMAGAPFAARFDMVSGSTPAATWIRRMGPSLSFLHGLALDGDGLLVAFDVRPGSPTFTGARVAIDDGDIVWSRTWDLAGHTTNRALTVTVHGGNAIFAGRIGVTPFDPTRGDGLLLALDPATGDYEWGALYYGGRGAEEIVTTFITGVVSTPSGLWTLSYQTPGNLNQHHFWGRWYQAIDDTLDFPGGDGSMRLGDAALTAEAGLATDLATPANATAHVASITDEEWADVTPTLGYQDPVAAEAAAFRTGTHALLQRVTITP